MSNAPQIPAANPISPGQVLAGKYRVERVLGQGGMGVVVEARHIALDDRVAIKFLLPEFARHPDASTRFLREARAARKIKSEHVAKVSDVGELETGAPYMVMEFLEGRDLSQHLQREGVLTILDAIDYLIQGCEAIAEAHGYGIVHRDLKPANLFVGRRPDGTAIVKVLDFGISKDTNAGVDNLTKTTAALGSALYMSPEQMKQTRSVDHRTDIYALGITLYELLAGKQPFYADTLPQLCAEVLTGTPTPLRARRSDIPEQLAAVIERAFAREPAARYQSVAEFVVALAPFSPPRSQPTIERIARMGGIAAPAANGSSGVFAAPAAQAPTAQLPVMDPTTGQGAPPGWEAAPASVLGAAPPPSTANPNGPPSHIVPGPYSGPMSVRAAASFAQGATTNANLSTTGRQGGSSKAGTFALMVIALLAIGGGLVWALVLRPGAKPAPAKGTDAPAVSVSPPAPAPAPVAPPPTAAPAETTTPAPPAAEERAPAPSAQPEVAPSAAPSAHPHGGHAPVAPGRPAPQAPAAPQAPVRSIDPLDHP